jgi:hypothetical protein
MSRKRIDLTGKKFGKLTALKATQLILNRIRNGYEEYFQEYECQCDCGNIKLVTCFDLKRALHGKGVSSCGCANRKYQDEGDTWSTAFNLIWKNYVVGANNRKLKFKLTKENFSTLINDNCHYCGSIPTKIKKYGGKRKPSQITYNGVDRVDNEIGYLLSNCVTCCHLCNIMKLALSKKAFLDHVQKIHNHLIANMKLTKNSNNSGIG